MAEVRKRRTDGSTTVSPDSKDKANASTVSAPSPFGSVTAVLTLTGAVIVGALYFLDPLQYLGQSSSSSSASSPSPSIELTDVQLRAYDGSDPSTPIYVAINGTIFDVTPGRAFYGPGGHYAHFAGRDATRAWVTECFEGEEQWTHDLRGVEEMFMPKYIDEVLHDTAKGGDTSAFGLGEGVKLPDSIRDQAKVALDKIGPVSKKTRQKRRQDDLPEARDRVQKALEQWVGFFTNNPKYEEVGRVVRDPDWEKTAPSPPELCEKAKKKRPIKGGKLEGSMGKMMQMAMGGQQKKDEMPDYVKEMLAANKKTEE